jgi:hypothetical protein
MVLLICSGGWKAMFGGGQGDQPSWLQLRMTAVEFGWQWQASRLQRLRQRQGGKALKLYPSKLTDSSPPVPSKMGLQNEKSMMRIDILDFHCFTKHFILQILIRYLWNSSHQLATGHMLILALMVPGYKIWQS